MGGLSGVARTDGFIRRRVLYPPPTTPLRVMLVGDSQTVGNGGAGDEAAAYRESFYRTFKAQRGELRLVGNAVVGPTGRDSVLSDWRMAATGGQTIQQADAQAAAAEALDGIADVYVVLAGTNNIALGNSVPTMLAAMATLVRNRLAANPAAYVLVLNLYPWVPPATNYAANNATRLAFNAALPGYLAARFPTWQVFVVPAGSLLSPAHMNASGLHANYAGNNIVGAAAAEAVVRVSQSFIGATWPRDPMRRTARPAVYLSGQFGQLVRIPADAGTVTPLGAVSFTTSLLLYPTDQGAIFERSVFTQYPGGGVRNIWLNAYSTGGPGDNMQAFVGTSAFPACQANGVLRLNTWHAIMLSANIDTLLVQLWVMRAGTDGRWVNTMGAAGYASGAWNLVSADAILGAVPALDGLPGVYSDFSMCVGSAAEPEDAEAYYHLLAPPPGTTAYYELAEGGGVNINPTPAFPALPVGTLTGFWAAAGTAPTPWDLGVVNDLPLTAQHTVAKAEWSADASLLNAAAQVLPAGSGPSTSLTSTAAVQVAEDGYLGTFYIAYTGDPSNVGGQQVTFDLLLNGASISTLGGLASNTITPQVNSVHFPAVPVNAGDLLQVILTPSAPLTGPVVAISASAS